jgi:quercetin dioxygenase-like cupin family protein
MVCIRNFCGENIMARYLRTSVIAVCLALGAGLLWLPVASVEQTNAEETPAFAGSKVTHLITFDLTGVPNRQVIANIYEVSPGSVVPRHRHPGDEFHLVLSGEWAAEVEGRPVHTMKPGDSQYVEREHWHGGKVVGEVPLKLLGVMIVDKDKPVTETVR